MSSTRSWPTRSNAKNKSNAGGAWQLELIEALNPSWRDLYLDFL